MKHKKLIIFIYVLYLLAFVTKITALIGIVMAYVLEEKGNTADASHFTYQKRTFWIYFVYAILSLFLGAAIYYAVNGQPADLLNAWRNLTGHHNVFGSIRLWGWWGIHHLYIFIPFFLTLAWFAARCIRGLALAADEKAIKNPNTWWV